MTRLREKKKGRAAFFFLHLSVLSDVVGLPVQPCRCVRLRQIRRLDAHGQDANYPSTRPNPRPGPTAWRILQLSSHRVKPHLFNVFAGSLFDDLQADGRRNVKAHAGT